MKLLPKPESRLPVLVYFDRLDLAIQAVVDIFQPGIVPSSLEFMDQPSLQAVDEFLHFGFPREAEALPAIEVDGDRELVNRQSRRVAQACEKLGAVRVRTASCAGGRRTLEGPPVISPALFRIRPNKINEDIVVSRSRIPEAIARFQTIGGQTGRGGRQFRPCRRRKHPRQCHVRQENPTRTIHSLPGGRRNLQNRYRIGGTLSGEHGIGLAKASYLSWELDPSLCG